jgi:hypothetical protein
MLEGHQHAASEVVASHQILELHDIDELHVALDFFAVFADKKSLVLNTFVGSVDLVQYSGVRIEVNQQIVLYPVFERSFGSHRSVILVVLDQHSLAYLLSHHLALAFNDDYQTWRLFTLLHYVIAERILFRNNIQSYGH